MDHAYPFDSTADPYPGLRLERRAFLKLSAAALAGLLLGCHRREILSDVDTLFGEVHPLASRLVASANSRDEEEGYLARVAALASRLEGIPPFDYSEDEGWTGVSLRKAFPVEILQFRMDPGARMPCHDHRDMLGVVLGLEGRMEATSYEILGKDPLPQGDFRVRRTRVEAIIPGVTSALGRRRDNLHALEAGPEGVRFLDIFTRFREEAGSHFLHLEPAGEGLYAARWA